MYAQLTFPNRVVSFNNMGRDIRIKDESKGNSIPIVSNDSLQKIMKSSLFAYMICVKDSPNPNVSNDSQTSNDEGKIPMKILNQI